jgi:hypothetical protein
MLAVQQVCMGVPHPSRWSVPEVCTGQLHAHEVNAAEHRKH